VFYLQSSQAKGRKSYRRNQLYRDDNKTPDDPDEEEKKEMISNLNHVENVAKAVGAGVTWINNIRDDKEKVRQIGSMIDQADQKAHDLANYKDSVQNVLGPFISSVFSDLEDSKASLKDKSAVALRVSQWQVQGTLRKMNGFIEDFTQAFPQVSKKYTRVVENLKEAFNLQIDLYNQIQEAMEHMRFADYIANIHSDVGEKTGLGRYEEMYKQLEIALLGSLIMNEWETTIQNFYQWTFPLSKQFERSFEAKKFPDYLSRNFKSTTELLELLIPDIENWMGDLRIELKKYKAALVPAIDDELIRSAFQANSESTVPFYSWTWEEHQDIIEHFLLGNMITVSIQPDFADDHHMSAVKFSFAEIALTARDPEDQPEIDRLLNSLRIKMVHSGISRYLYEDQKYEMIGARQVIQYNFERNQTGHRMAANNIYNKMEKGDLILSPYTVWTFQLFKAHPLMEFGFLELSQFSRKVDMNLVGMGSFVRKKSKASIKGRSEKTKKGKKSGSQSKSLPLFFYRFRNSGFPKFEGNSPVKGLFAGF